MTNDLLKLLGNVIRKEEVGTLFLGKGTRVRRIFLSGGEAHLLEPGKECRFLPTQLLFESERISPAALEELLMEERSSPQSLSSLLGKRGLAPKEQLRLLAQEEVIEEILMILARSGEHFFFEAGSVPEELLLPSPDQPHGVPVQDFFEAVLRRKAELQSFAQVFPSLEELPVLSERGMAAMNAGESWLYSQVAALIDGFRTVRRIVIDCPFFPHRTGQILVQAARDGCIRKTLFPELEGIQPSKVDVTEAASLVERFEEAAEMAVDDLPLRRRLAALALRAGMQDKAVYQLNLIGDMLLGRQLLSQALESYRDALRCDPSSVLLQEKILRVHRMFAAQAFQRGDANTGRRFLEEALNYRSGDLGLYLLIVESYGDDEAGVIQIAARLVANMEKQGHDQLPLQFFPALLDRFPNSDAIRKRYVNYLLDHGRREDAVRELEFLAGSLLDRGRTGEARKVYEKIGILSPSHQPPPQVMQRLAVPRARKRTLRPSWGFTIVTLCILVYAGYQVYLYTAINELHQKAFAIVTSDCPNPASAELEDYQTVAEEVLLECRSFQRRHLLSIWSPILRNTCKTLENRVTFTDRMLNAYLSDLWSKAERAEILGRLERAQSLYEQVEKRGERTPWAERARRSLTRLENYTSGSEELLLAANKAIDAKDFKKAFALCRQLLYDYPRSPAAHNVTLPITITSDPPGATVTSGDRNFGTTPVVIRVHPLEPTELHLHLDGYRSDTVTVDDPDDPVVHCKLAKQ